MWVAKVKKTNGQNKVRNLQAGMAGRDDDAEKSTRGRTNLDGGADPEPT